MTTSKTQKTGKSAIIAKVCEDLELFVSFQKFEHKAKSGEMTL